MPVSCMLLLSFWSLVFVLQAGTFAVEAGWELTTETILLSALGTTHAIVDRAHPHAQNSSEPLMYVGRECTDDGATERGGDIYSFLKFDLSGVKMPPEDISHVWLRLHVLRSHAQQMRLSVYEAQSQWDLDVTWDTMPRAEFSSAGRLGDLSLSVQAPGVWAEHRLDITRAALRWLRRPATNNGLVFREDSQECLSKTAIATADHVDPHRHPRIDLNLRVDRGPPTTTILKGPQNLTSSSSVSFVFSGNDSEMGVASFECRLESQPLWRTAAFSSCTSPLTLDGLEDGSYTFQARAVDHSGNVDPKPPSMHFLVDTCPPEVSLERVPVEDDRAASATFSFATADCRGQGGSGIAGVTCMVDGVARGPCDSPLTLVGLKEGRHTLQVRAEDRAGNVGESATWEWEVRLPPKCSLAVEPGPVLITASGPSMVKSKPFQVTVKWSRPVVSFAPSNIEIGGPGAELTGWAASDDGTTYSATVAPTQSGHISLQVPPGSVMDTDGVESMHIASGTVLVSYDDTPPTCTITGPGKRMEEPFTVTFTWSEPVQEFSAADVALSGAPCEIQGPLAANPRGTQFTATMVPGGTGAIHVSVPAKSARDFAGNGNEASDELSVLIANAKIYVAEEGRGSVRVFTTSLSSTRGTSETSLRRQLSFREQPALTGTTSAASVSVDPEGLVYVADSSRSVIRVYAPSGSGGRGGGHTTHRLRNSIAGFSNITAVAQGSEGRLLVADSSSKAVHVIGRSGPPLGTLGGDTPGGDSTVALAAPSALHVDGDGNVYVADAERGCVQVYNGTSLEHLATIGGMDLEEGTDWLQSPRAVAVDGWGRVYVADTDAHAVKVFHPESHRLIGTIGTPGVAGSGELQLSFPMAVDINHQGFVLVCDTGNNRMQVFTAPPGPLTQSGNATSSGAQWGYMATLPGLARPIGVALHRDKSAPTCTVEGPRGPQTGPFQIRVRWSDRVAGMPASAVVLGGTGGTLEGSALSTDDSVEYVGTVRPGGIGTVTVNVPPWATANDLGNGNPRGCGGLRVEFMGGSCAAEMGCRWRLAAHEHSLALERMKIESQERTEREKEALRLQVRVQREAEERQEQARRLSAEHESELRVRGEAAVASARAAAEADARVRETKETEGVRLREIAAKGKETRAALVAGIETAVRAVGEGLQAMAAEPWRLVLLVGAAALLAASFFGTKEMARALARHVERLLGTPTLVRETSRRGPLAGIVMLRHILLGRFSSRPKAPHLIFTPDLVLSEDLGRRLRLLALGIANSRRLGAPLRNVLFHGPPGTGKTMAAERLARASGLDYAIISGGDVAPLGAGAVTQLHHLFDWAQSSRRGVLLFIDEADAFLRRREVAHALKGLAAPVAGGGDAMGEGMRAALTALLARTGGQSKRFMMVLATNRPQDLDTAILDRIDDALEFPLPEVELREAMLRLYLRKYLAVEVPCLGAAAAAAKGTAGSNASARGGSSSSRKCQGDSPTGPGTPEGRSGAASEEARSRKGDRRGSGGGKAAMEDAPGGELRRLGRGPKAHEEEGEKASSGSPMLGSGRTRDRGQRRRGWLSSFFKRAPDVVADGIDEGVLRKAAQRTDGFSGRQLAKLMAAVQVAVFAQDGSDGPLLLTPAVFLDVVSTAVQGNVQKASFASKF